MARGWHYTKLSLSSALRLYFSGRCFLYFVIIVPFSLSFLFICVCVCVFCRCSSDLFLSSRPRTGLATTYITGYS